LNVLEALCELSIAGDNGLKSKRESGKERVKSMKKIENREENYINNTCI